MRRIIFTLIVMICSAQVLSKEFVIFNNEDYQLIQSNDNNCSLLRIYYKKSNINKNISSFEHNNHAFPQKICFHADEHLKFYPGDKSELYDNRYLRVNYAESGVVDADEHKSKHVIYEKCAILDLEKAVMLNDGNARDGLCAESNFNDYLFNFNGF